MPVKYWINAITAKVSAKLRNMKVKVMTSVAAKAIAIIKEI
jgi:hypothetical protein